MPTPDKGDMRISREESAYRLPSIALIMLLIGTPIQALYANDNAYLEALEKEAEKVEQRDVGQRANDADPDSAGTQLPLSNANQTAPAISRDEFEAMLKQRYRGIDAFYSKLTQRSKEEIYDNYTQGTDIKTLREKVLKRYRHEHPQ